MKNLNVIDLNSYIRISTIKEQFEKECLYITSQDSAERINIENTTNIIFENSQLKSIFFDKLNLMDIQHTVINCLSSVEIFEDTLYNATGVVIFDNVCSCRNNEILKSVINYNQKKLLVC